MSDDDDARVPLPEPAAEQEAPVAAEPTTVVPEHLGDAEPEDDGEDVQSLIEQVEQPAKVMRLGRMIKQLLDEVRAAPLDEAARDRLLAVHEASLAELRTGLAGELQAELDRITLPFAADTTPSDAELRIAQAQLVGWLEGLFHGIQTALLAQQVQAQHQLSQLGQQRQLPPGAGPGGGAPEGGDDGSPHPGQYL